jgi:hypothetical protein
MTLNAFLHVCLQNIIFRMYLSKGFSGDGELVHAGPLPVLDGRHATVRHAVQAADNVMKLFCLSVGDVRSIDSGLFYWSNWHQKTVELLISTSVNLSADSLISTSVNQPTDRLISGAVLYLIKLSVHLFIVTGVYQVFFTDYHKISKKIKIKSYFWKWFFKEFLAVNFRKSANLTAFNYTRRNSISRMNQLSLNLQLQKLKFMAVNFGEMVKIRKTLILMYVWMSW